MKTLLKIVAYFLFLIPFTVKAQENWTSYLTSIPVKGYEGHKFKLSILAKVEAEDDSAAARLFARVDLKKGGYGFFDNMWNRPIKHSKWQQYAIEGKIAIFGGKVMGLF